MTPQYRPVGPLGTLGPDVGFRPGDVEGRVSSNVEGSSSKRPDAP